MPMNANGVLARLYKHRNDAHTEPRVCYVPGCIQPAIWSHLMQKNGQLSELADASGHVVEPTTDDPFRARKAGDGHVNYYFRKIHKNEAFTFLGFCNEHDTNLFRSVETPGADITAGNGPMLLSYRGFLNELQKIENNRNWYRRIFKDRELLEGMACHEARRLARIRELDSAYRYVIEIEQRIKQAFEQELGIGRGPAPAPASHETAKFKFLCLQWNVYRFAPRHALAGSLHPMKSSEGLMQDSMVDILPRVILLPSRLHQKARRRLCLDRILDTIYHTGLSTTRCKSERW